MAAAGFQVEIEPLDEAAYWTIGDKTLGDGYRSLELVLMDFAGGIDPSENLVWFRPDQVGVYNWSGFASDEFEALYQTLVTETDTTKRVEVSRRMEDLMERSGGFVFICHEPLIVAHRDVFEPVILPDGHPNPVAFVRG
jgi:peptide/nickel transport system substrate-binding protein